MTPYNPNNSKEHTNQHRRVAADAHRNRGGMLPARPPGLNGRSKRDTAKLIVKGLDNDFGF